MTIARSIAVLLILMSAASCRPAAAAVADASCVYLGLGCATPSPPPLPSLLPGPLYPPVALDMASPPPEAQPLPDMDETMPVRPRRHHHHTYRRRQARSLDRP